MPDRLTFFCEECARQFVVGPRQKESTVYERALRHVVNVHHKVGPKAHAALSERMSTEPEGK